MFSLFVSSFSLPHIEEIEVCRSSPDLTRMAVIRRKKEQCAATLEIWDSSDLVASFHPTGAIAPPEEDASDDFGSWNAESARMLNATDTDLFGSLAEDGKEVRIVDVAFQGDSLVAVLGRNNVGDRSCVAFVCLAKAANDSGDALLSWSKMPNVTQIQGYLCLLMDAPDIRSMLLCGGQTGLTRSSVATHIISPNDTDDEIEMKITEGVWKIQADGDRQALWIQLDQVLCSVELFHSGHGVFTYRILHRVPTNNNLVTNEAGYQLSHWACGQRYVFVHDPEFSEVKMWSLQLSTAICIFNIPVAPEVVNIFCSEDAGTLIAVASVPQGHSLSPSRTVQEQAEHEVRQKDINLRFSASNSIVLKLFDTEAVLRKFFSSKPHAQRQKRVDFMKTFLSENYSTELSQLLSWNSVDRLTNARAALYETEYVLPWDTDLSSPASIERVSFVNKSIVVLGKTGLALELLSTGEVKDKYVPVNGGLLIGVIRPSMPNHVVELRVVEGKGCAALLATNKIEREQLLQTEITFDFGMAAETLCDLNGWDSSKLERKTLEVAIADSAQAVFDVLNSTFLRETYTTLGSVRRASLAKHDKPRPMRTLQLLCILCNSVRSRFDITPDETAARRELKILLSTTLAILSMMLKYAYTVARGHSAVATQLAAKLEVSKPIAVPFEVVEGEFQRGMSVSSAASHSHHGIPYPTALLVEDLYQLTCITAGMRTLHDHVVMSGPQKMKATEMVWAPEQRVRGVAGIAAKVIGVHRGFSPVIHSRSSLASFRAAEMEERTPLNSWNYFVEKIIQLLGEPNSSACSALSWVNDHLYVMHASILAKLDALCLQSDSVASEGRSSLYFTKRLSEVRDNDECAMTTFQLQQLTSHIVYSRLFNASILYCTGLPDQREEALLSGVQCWNAVEAAFGKMKGHAFFSSLARHTNQCQLRGLLNTICLVKKSRSLWRNDQERCTFLLLQLMAFVALGANFGATTPESCMAIFSNRLKEAQKSLPFSAVDCSGNTQLFVAKDGDDFADDDETGDPQHDPGVFHLGNTQLKTYDVAEISDESGVTFSSTDAAVMSFLASQVVNSGRHSDDDSSVVAPPTGYIALTVAWCNSSHELWFRALFEQMVIAYREQTELDDLAAVMETIFTGVELPRRLQEQIDVLGAIYDRAQFISACFEFIVDHADLEAAVWVAPYLEKAAARHECGEQQMIGDLILHLLYVGCQTENEESQGKTSKVKQVVRQELMLFSEVRSCIIMAAFGEQAQWDSGVLQAVLSDLLVAFSSADDFSQCLATTATGRSLSQLARAVEVAIFTAAIPIELIVEIVDIAKLWTSPVIIQAAHVLPRSDLLRDQLSFLFLLAHAEAKHNNALSSQCSLQPFLKASLGWLLVKKRSARVSIKILEAAASNMTMLKFLQIAVTEVRECLQEFLSLRRPELLFLLLSFDEGAIDLEAVGSLIENLSVEKADKEAMTAFVPTLRLTSTCHGDPSSQLRTLGQLQALMETAIISSHSEVFGNSLKKVLSESLLQIGENKDEHASDHGKAAMPSQKDIEEFFSPVGNSAAVAANLQRWKCVKPLVANAENSINVQVSWELLLLDERPSAAYQRFCATAEISSRNAINIARRHGLLSCLAKASGKRSAPQTPILSQENDLQLLAPQSRVAAVAVFIGMINEEERERFLFDAAVIRRIAAVNNQSKTLKGLCEDYSQLDTVSSSVESCEAAKKIFKHLTEATTSMKMESEYDPVEGVPVAQLSSRFVAVYSALLHQMNCSESNLLEAIRQKLKQKDWIGAFYDGWSTGFAPSQLLELCDDSKLPNAIHECLAELDSDKSDEVFFSKRWKENRGIAKFFTAVFRPAVTEFSKEVPNKKFLAFLLTASSGTTSKIKIVHVMQFVASNLPESCSLAKDLSALIADAQSLQEDDVIEEFLDLLSISMPSPEETLSISLAASLTCYLTKEHGDLLSWATPLLQIVWALQLGATDELRSAMIQLKERLTQQDAPKENISRLMRKVLRNSVKNSKLWVEVCEECYALQRCVPGVAVITLVVALWVKELVQRVPRAVSALLLQGQPSTILKDLSFVEPEGWSTETPETLERRLRQALKKVAPPNSTELLSDFEVIAECVLHQCGVTPRSSPSKKIGRTRLPNVAEKALVPENIRSLFEEECCLEVTLFSSHSERVPVLEGLLEQIVDGTEYCQAEAMAFLVQLCGEHINEELITFEVCELLCQWQRSRLEMEKSPPESAVNLVIGNCEKLLLAAGESLTPTALLTLLRCVVWPASQGIDSEKATPRVTPQEESPSSTSLPFTIAASLRNMSKRDHFFKSWLSRNFGLTFDAASPGIREDELQEEEHFTPLLGKYLPDAFVTHLRRSFAKLGKAREQVEAGSSVNILQLEKEHTNMLWQVVGALLHHPDPGAVETVHALLVDSTDFFVLKRSAGLSGVQKAEQAENVRELENPLRTLVSHCCSAILQCHFVPLIIDCAQRVLSRERKGSDLLHIFEHSTEEFFFGADEFQGFGGHGDQSGFTCRERIHSFCDLLDKIEQVVSLHGGVRMTTSVKDFGTQIFSMLTKFQNFVKLPSSAHYQQIFIEPLALSVVHGHWIAEHTFDASFVAELAKEMKTVVSICVIDGDFELLRKVAFSINDVTVLKYVCDATPPQFLSALANSSPEFVKQDLHNSTMRIAFMKFFEVVTNLANGEATESGSSMELTTLYANFRHFTALGASLEQEASNQMQSFISKCTGSKKSLIGGGKEAMRKQIRLLEEIETQFLSAGNFFIQDSMFERCLSCIKNIHLLRVQKKYLSPLITILGLNYQQVLSTLAALEDAEDVIAVAYAYNIRTVEDWAKIIFHHVVLNGRKEVFVAFKAQAVSLPLDLGQRIKSMYFDCDSSGVGTSALQTRKSNFKWLDHEIRGSSISRPS